MNKYHPSCKEYFEYFNVLLCANYSVVKCEPYLLHAKGILYMTKQTFQNLKQKHKADLKGRKKNVRLTVVMILLVWLLLMVRWQRSAPFLRQSLREAEAQVLQALTISAGYTRLSLDRFLTNSQKLSIVSTLKAAF